jgi:hypothetical protein
MWRPLQPLSLQDGREVRGVVGQRSIHVQIGRVVVNRVRSHDDRGDGDRRDPGVPEGEPDTK